MNPTLALFGIPDDDDEESPSLERKAREDLIELVKGLTNLTAQQAREMSRLRNELSKHESS